MLQVFWFKTSHITFKPHKNQITPAGRRGYFFACANMRNYYFCPQKLFFKSIPRFLHIKYPTIGIFIQKPLPIRKAAFNLNLTICIKIITW